MAIPLLFITLVTIGRPIYSETPQGYYVYFIITAYNIYLQKEHILRPNRNPSKE